MLVYFVICMYFWWHFWSDFEVSVCTLIMFLCSNGHDKYHQLLGQKWSILVNFRVTFETNLILYTIIHREYLQNQLKWSKFSGTFSDFCINTLLFPMSHCSFIQNDLRNDQFWSILVIFWSNFATRFWVECLYSHYVFVLRCH